MAKFRGGALLSSRTVNEIEAIFSESQITVEDCLRLSEFIFWKIERTLQSCCQAAGQESSTAGQQNVISKMRDDLYSFCIRAFILQLVHSMTHRNSKIKLGHSSSAALLGYIHHLHLTLKCRHKEEPINELVLLCKECFDWLEPIWAEFEKDPNKADLNPNASEAGTVGPAEDIMANLKETAEGAVVGSKVDAANRNYRMAYGMAVGIEASVRVANGMKLYNSCVYGMSSFKQELENQMQLREFPYCCVDFSVAADWHGSEMSHDIINFALSTITLRYSLPENGGVFSPTHILGESEHVWFEDLAPALFSRIRNICKVDSKQYLDSVARREFSFIEFTTNSKSGEVFFFSHDGKFLLKTISNKEAAVLLKMLPDYLSHLQHQTSFLMRICGLHRVCTGQSRKVRHFLVAISVFDCQQLGLHHQFDLKGSTAGRVSGPSENVKKDVNWIQGRSTIWLPIDLKRLLASIVEEDGKFLSKQNVLDYSILIGIHDRRSPNKGVQCRSVKLLANILREKVLPLISKVRKLQRQNAEGTPR